jgi:hypothetical protein
MGGAPPKVYQYYRKADASDKVILEDLYNSYDVLIKLKDKAEVNPIAYSRLRGNIILYSAFNDLNKHGNNKGYPEFLISLFLKYSKIFGSK